MCCADDSALIERPELSEAERIAEQEAQARNFVGMVAWRLRAFSPEYPERCARTRSHPRSSAHVSVCLCASSVGGQDIIVIANDITFEIGSFGVREDILFQLGRARLRTGACRVSHHRRS